MFSLELSGPLAVWDYCSRFGGWDGFLNTSPATLGISVWKSLTWSSFWAQVRLRGAESRSAFIIPAEFRCGSLVSTFLAPDLERLSAVVS